MQPEPDPANDARLNVLLDPSVLLTVPSLDRIGRELPGLREHGLRFFVAPTFANAVRSTALFRQLPLFVGNARPPQRSAVRGAIEAFGIASFEMPEWAAREFAEVVEGFLRPPLNPTEAQILFEEWYFLAHQSALVSRTRRVVKELAKGVQAGAIELLGPLVDRAIRATLRKGEEEQISRLERLKAIGKWIVIGGDVAIPFLPPALQATWAALNAPFVIFDP
jgi:hypothetical protein